MKHKAAWMAAMVAAAVATTAAWGDGGDMAVTVYNGNFACVREARELDLKEGENALRLTDMSAQLEPDSVILRETGGEAFGVDILEQRYVNEPLTEAIMLRQMEGKDVRLRVTGKDGETREETGRLLRAGGNGGAGPIVEMPDGVRFSMPGQPLFDGVEASAYLKPSLEWLLRSDWAGRCPVEVSYLTGGLSWETTYNLVAPEEGGDEYAFSGWVSMRNDSGKDYPGAELKLITGDVAKLSNWQAWGGVRRRREMDPPDCSYGPAVEERSFDEFHLYTLPRRATLKNGEHKQIEFLRADGVRGERQYVYEPLRNFHGTYGDRSREAGLNNEKKVAVRIVISNSETNGLGIPLPRGKMRLYRRDAKDGRPEFTGESVIDHTPKDKQIQLDNGYAFDLAAERTQTDFTVGLFEATETFRIKIRNHKENAVTVRAIEHPWRWANWEIAAESAPHEKNCVPHRRVVARSPRQRRNGADLHRPLHLEVTPTLRRARLSLPHLSPPISYVLCPAPLRRAAFPSLPLPPQKNLRSPLPPCKMPP